MVEVRVLGPLQVVHAGEVARVSSSRTRELLELLTTRPGCAVTPQQLIDELWDGAPPPTAASALRVHIGSVRKLLHPDGPAGGREVVALEAGCYVLRAHADMLDTLRFEALAAAGHEANLRGDAERADEDLGAAVGCWRGPAFPDIRCLSAAQPAITRLEQMRQAAIEELVDVRLFLGKPASVIELLVTALDEFPLHERLAAQLMLALYRSGRQAEALRVYTALAQRLDEQLGVKPCAEVRQLEEDIILQRAHLDLPSEPAAVASAAIGHREHTRCIGRRSELARLIELHDTAAAGERRLVLVSGPSGIGKTTLVREYCARARRTAAPTIFAACARTPTGAYDVIAQLVDGVAAVSPALRDRAAELAARLRGDRPDQRAPTDADVDSSTGLLQLHEAVASLFVALGGKPTVVAIDDLHRADGATLQVLRHVLRHAELDALLVVGTCCDDELEPATARRIDALLPPMQTERIALGGFDVHEVRALVRGTASGSALPALLELAPRISDAAGGSPLFADALVRELDEMARGGATRDAIARAVTTLAPGTARALVEQKVAQLSPAARDVVHAAAVVDRAVSTALLASVTARPVESLTDAIEEVLAAQLLDEDDWHVGTFRFHHTLIRNAVYHEIDPDERRRLHLAVADALEQRDVPEEPGRSAELAHHLAAAVPLAEPGRASDWARRAGDDDAATLSFATAAEWYERALVLADEAGRPQESSARTELALGRAYEAEREFARAHEVFMRGAQHALAAADVEALADLAVAAGGPWSWPHEHGAIVQQLEAALHLVGDHHPERRVRLLVTLATAVYFADAEREDRLVDEALVLAKRTGNDMLLTIAYSARHLALTHRPSERCERLAVADTAMTTAIASGLPMLRLRIERERLTDVLENGQIERFGELLDGYESLAAEQCSPRDIYWSMAVRATDATLRGDLGAGEQLARGAQLRGSDLHEMSSGAELLQRFVIRFQQGRLPEMTRDLMREPNEQSPPSRQAFRGGGALAAVTCAETGRVVDALRIAEWVLGSGDDPLPKDLFWLAAHALLSLVAAAADDAALAEQIAEQIATCPDHVVVFGAAGAVLGSAHHWLGLLESTRGRWPRAAEHLEEAVRVSEHLDAPYWRAQAQLDLAFALCGGGRSTDDRVVGQLAQEAVTAAHRGGFGRLLPRAARLR